jgi:hypothetical protein
VVVVVVVLVLVHAWWLLSSWHSRILRRGPTLAGACIASVLHVHGHARACVREKMFLLLQDRLVAGMFITRRDGNQMI